MSSNLHPSSPIHFKPNIPLLHPRRSELRPLSARREEPVPRTHHSHICRRQNHNIPPPLPPRPKRLIPYPIRRNDQQARQDKYQARKGALIPKGVPDGRTAGSGWARGLFGFGSDGLAHSGRPQYSHVSLAMPGRRRQGRLSSKRPAWPTWPDGGCMCKRRSKTLKMPLSLSTSERQK